MILGFWERRAELYLSSSGRIAKSQLVKTDNVGTLYELWQSMPDEERGNATLSLDNRVILDANAIGGLASRKDFPFR